MLLFGDYSVALNSILLHKHTSILLNKVVHTMIYILISPQVLLITLEIVPGLLWFRGLIILMVNQHCSEKL